MLNCEFCLGIADKTSEPYSLKYRIIFQSPNFIVFPGLGQIVEGYLLISPKKHFSGMGSLPPEYYEELENVTALTRQILTDTYCTPVIFEHGTVSECKRAGGCIEHAHLHLMPIGEDIKEDLAKNFSVKKILALNDLKLYTEQEKPYFFLENQAGERFAFSIPDKVPSQYIRKVIAAKTGQPEKEDWAVYPGLKEIENTIKKIEPKFKSLSETAKVKKLNQAR